MAPRQTVVDVEGAVVGDVTAGKRNGSGTLQRLVSLEVLVCSVLVRTSAAGAGTAGGGEADVDVGVVRLGADALDTGVQVECCLEC